MSLIIISGSGTVVALSLLAVLSVGRVHWPVQMLDTLFGEQVWHAPQRIPSCAIPVYQYTLLHMTCTDRYVCACMFCFCWLNCFSISLNKRLTTVFSSHLYTDSHVFFMHTTHQVTNMNRFWTYKPMFPAWLLITLTLDLLVVKWVNKLSQFFFKGSQSIFFNYFFYQNHYVKLMELVKINVGDKNTEYTIQKVILLYAGHVVDVSTN